MKKLISVLLSVVLALNCVSAYIAHAENGEPETIVDYSELNEDADDLEIWGEAIEDP